MTALIDFATLGTDIMTILGPAATAAVTVGGTILAASVGWRFLKRFGK